MRRRGAWTVAILTLVVLAAPALAQSVEITGAAYAELDETTGLWQLRGNPVVMRRGAMILRAPSIIFDTRRQMVRATGGVAYADETLRLEAQEIVGWWQEERLLATVQVRGEQVRGEDRISLTADRLEAFQKERRLVASGTPVITTADGTLSADRIAIWTEREELLAEGSARIVRGDLEGVAPQLLLRRREGVAVLSGGALVRQGGDEARAQTITIDLRQRRFVASGQARVIIQPGR